MKFTVLLLILSTVLLAHSLPILSSMSISSSDKDNHEVILKNDFKLNHQNEPTPSPTQAIIDTPALSISDQEDEDEDGCPSSNFPIPVERFAQLVSTHWQFDHFDSIKSGTYKLISEQFQKHITISIQQKTIQQGQSKFDDMNNSRQRSFKSLRSSSWDLMDLEILQAQIFGAIQAHTEGSLHLAWDRLADKLGQPAFDVYIRNIASKLCSFSTDATNLISSTCLKENAAQLSTEMENYIKEGLIQVFESLDNGILPQLLSNTSKDLFDVLDYFNRLFSLGENQELSLQVTSWQPQVENLKSTLLSLLDTSILNDDHLIDFFSNYACLSRV